MTKLYLECQSGISGDMFVAALLDLGADEQVLREVLKTVPADGFEIKISRVKKAGLDVCDFDVVLAHELDNHDHDMEYLYGHTHIHSAEYIHKHESAHTTAESVEHTHKHESAHTTAESVEHTHEHESEQAAVAGAEHIHEHVSAHTTAESVEHTHEHEPAHTTAAGTEHSRDHTHHHHHTHRGLAEVNSIINGTTMTDHARHIAKEIFAVLARAEAKAHGTTIDEVHFHEVGAIDSIVDIISAAVCLDNLGITDVIIPYLAEGTGTVRCAHGIIPIPVPAVCNIVVESGLIIKQTEVKGELVTPTGAAIAAAICTEKKLPEQYSIRKIGIGAGKREYERPSMVRAMLIEDMEHDKSRNHNCTAQTDISDIDGNEISDSKISDIKKAGNSIIPDISTAKIDDTADKIYKLESNIDDCTGENLGFVMDKLIKAGARDVHYTPVFMKKNRPAYQLNVICKKEDISKLSDIIFEETTTIGIRRVEMERSILKRETRSIKTSVGEAVIKVCSHGNSVKIYPEYDSVVDICNKTGLSYNEAFRIIQQEGHDYLQLSQQAF